MIVELLRWWGGGGVRFLIISDFIEKSTVIIYAIKGLK